MMQRYCNRVAVVVALLAGIGACGLHSPASGQSARLAKDGPDPLTAEQQELLNYAYLSLRPDLLAAIKPTGDQRLIVRRARMRMNAIITLYRTREGEAVLGGGRGGGAGMVKFILQDLAYVRAALTDDQRQAFAKLVAEQPLKQITVDAAGQHFLLNYTFAPGDRIEKAKTSEGRIVEVVVPEKDDINLWHTELDTADDVVRALDHELIDIRSPAGEWLIRRGADGLNASTKARLAEQILNWCEKGEVANTGWWLQVYSQMAQPDHEKRVLTLLDKSNLHQLSGTVAAYASIAPAKALDYIARPRADKQYAIRAVQGLGMAPDALRLLQSARVKMPDMKWMIDEQVKSVTELRKARAEGRPENPGEAAMLRQRKQAQLENEARAKSGKTPGEYQEFKDWFADFSSDERARVEKAAYHFSRSVHAVDLSQVSAQQRAAVFKIAHAALIAPKTIFDRANAGKILVASASANDADELARLVRPDNGLSQYPLGALMRVNADKAGQVLLSLEFQKFSPRKILEAAKLAPAEALPVLEKTKTLLKSPNTIETYEKYIAELKKTEPAP